MKGLRRHILVAVDFHETSLTALDQIIHLANFVRGHIVLLHVIETGYFLPEGFRLNKKQLDKLRVEVTGKLESLANRYAEHEDIDITTRVEEGKVFEKVIEVSRDIKARTIVIGKNAKDSKHSDTLGSNAYKILNHSSIPVVCYVRK